ncbi:MAG: hypothetical protein EON54_11440 [Alcaligenaceae bacterium]|nr:MAG: hypothetical protein EON54_11440 [Alcaligenaceae bacterium]
MTKKIINKKSFILPALFISLIANIIFLMMLVPIDGVVVGCSSTEKRLSLIGGDIQRMTEIKIRAEEIKKSTPPASEPPLGIAEGASSCSGLTYKLYIL